MPRDFQQLVLGRASLDCAVVGETRRECVSRAKLVTPSLTTVAQFQWQMGERAAQTLMDRLRGQKTGPGTAVEMPFNLIQRGSTRAT